MKKIWSAVTAIGIVISCMGCVSDSEVIQWEGPYEETHFQVNFGELEVDTSGG